MSPRVSVIIPTVGRKELERALASVAAQTRAPHEIIVVNDGVDDLELVADVSAPVRIVRTAGRVGAAEARNTGMRQAAGALCAFLDDDDTWLPDHLERAVQFLDDHPEIDVYSCAAMVCYGSVYRVEPTVLYRGTTTLYDFYYGRLAWARRRRRIPTPTLVFRSEVRAVEMTRELTAYEDLWWLLEAERRGFKVSQSATVGVVVHADERREAGRRLLREELAWADRLEALSPSAGVSYLVGVVGRQLARSGQAAALRNLARTVRQHYRTPIDLRLVLLLEQVVAAGVVVSTKRRAGRERV